MECSGLLSESTTRYHTLQKVKNKQTKLSHHYHASMIEHLKGVKSIWGFETTCLGCINHPLWKLETGKQVQGPSSFNTRNSLHAVKRIGQQFRASLQRFYKQLNQQKLKTKRNLKCFFVPRNTIHTIHLPLVGDQPSKKP
jgi:hypothetical protein